MDDALCSAKYVVTILADRAKSQEKSSTEYSVRTSINSSPLLRRDDPGTAIFLEIAVS